MFAAKSHISWNALSVINESSSITLFFSHDQYAHMRIKIKKQKTGSRAVEHNALSNGTVRMRETANKKRPKRTEEESGKTASRLDQGFSCECLRSP